MSDDSLYDFKYTNDIKNYIESPQLHIYKYMYELLFNKKINHLYYVWIPKVGIRRKNNEQDYEFRNRLSGELNKKRVTIHEVVYDVDKVKSLKKIRIDIENAKEYPKIETPLCDWCEFKGYCKEGSLVDMLPKNEKRDTTKNVKIKMWLYGLPMCRKNLFC